MIRIVVTDDHTLFRQGVGKLLAAEPDMQVVAEAASAADAITQCQTLAPDIVLMDVGMPGLSSFEAARQIRRSAPQTRVVFLTMYDDEDYLSEAMQVGAAGYVLKDCPSAQLLSAIRDVHQGGSYLSPKMLAQLVHDFRSRSNGEECVPRSASLTPREREILKLIAEGLSVKEVASFLDLSVKTVEAHKFNLMRKLDIHNKAQLVQYAIQKKILCMPPPV
jgi:DNA-binding NarL/FixJ family response regulator